MRCEKITTRQCPTMERCELQGCQQPYGPPPTALIPERRPIDLDYKPSGFMRRLMALTDAGERMVRRGPTPFAALPDPALLRDVLHALEEPPMSQSMAAAMPLPIPGQEPARPPPAPSPQPGELRVVEVPGPAWLVYVGDKLLGLTQRMERMGPPQ